MTENQISTVMGPDRAPPARREATHNASTLNFVTKNTLENREALKKSAYVTRTLVKSDKKLAGILNCLGVMIFLAWDRLVRGLLRRTETTEPLKLEGNVGVEDRSETVNQMLKDFAEEIEFERITKEVDIVEGL